MHGFSYDPIHARPVSVAGEACVPVREGLCRPKFHLWNSNYTTVSILLA